MKKWQWAELEQEPVDLTWMSLEQLSQAFQVIAEQWEPEQLPRPLDKLKPEEWELLELLLIRLLLAKTYSSVH